jgi:endonuclease YncB( thermonuclease family)
MNGARRMGMIGILALVVLTVGGCREGEAASRPRPLAGSAPSIEALGQGVVEGFVTGDTARLMGYTLSLDEYRDVVWPRLGIDTVKTGVTFGWSWTDNQRRGNRAYRRYLERMKDLPLQAAETRCTGEPRRFPGVVVVQDCHVVVRDTAGRSERMELFSSVVEIGWRYKIFRYDD